MNYARRLLVLVASLGLLASAAACSRADSITGPQAPTSANQSLIMVGSGG
jgi:hypothetical protein